MNLRIFPVMWILLLGLTGCGERAADVADKPPEPLAVKPSETSETTSPTGQSARATRKVPSDSQAKPEAVMPIETYRADAAFDPNGRHFLALGAPGMPDKIHAVQVHAFVNKAGMGIGRGFWIEPSKDWVELIYVSEVERSASAGDAKGARPAYDAKTETMTLPDGTRRIVHELAWQLRSQQLMSVDAESGPAVYLPAANDVHALKTKKTATSANTPTRKLDPFETKALECLRKGDEVAMVTTSETTRMLGAIRASFQCVGCHKVPMGTLLGAFSYDLRLKPEGSPASDAQEKPVVQK